MKIRNITTIAGTGQLAPVWNDLAGTNPFLRWEWLSAWWEHFLGENQLFLLVGRDEHDRTVGIAPFYVDTTTVRGRVIHFLGSGKACSDHLTLLCQDEDRDRFASACADWLSESHTSTCESDHWDYIELIGGDEEDPAIRKLCQRLDATGHRVTRTSGQPCYYLELSSGWDNYVRQRSASTRRMIRKLQEQLAQPNTRVEVLTTPTQLAEHWPVFRYLHQRRHCALNDAGCFGHPGFDEFLQTATMRLAENSLVRLTLVSIDDIPVSASFNLETSDRSYNYQSGMDPDYERYRPGFLGLVHVLRDVERRGQHGLDLLRGDEPYKSRWRASRVETTEVRIPGRRARSVVMHQLWRTSNSVKSMLRMGLSGNEAGP